jgi:hypothetical protein
MRGGRETSDDGVIDGLVGELRYGVGRSGDVAA